MHNSQNLAAGLFGKRTDISDIFDKNLCALPDQDEFEEDFTSYLKRLARESKAKAEAEAETKA